MNTFDVAGALRRVSASIALFNAAGRLLLVHQTYGKRRWDFPGGIGEIGESLIETAMREVHEEIGLSVLPEALIGIYFTRSEARLSFVFRGTYAGEPIALQAGELDEYRWCTSDTLPPLTDWKRLQVMDSFAGSSAATLRTRE